MRPTFSIIIAVFNGEKTIERAINSVLSQSYSNFELIIIDGDSRDNSKEIIKKYNKYIEYWISERDDGVYDAWNKGIGKSRGEWISFLGADDEFRPDALFNYFQYIKTYSNESLDYISSKVALVADGKITKLLGKKWSWREFRRSMQVAHVGSIHHSSLYSRYGLYDKSFKIVGDYEFLLRPGEWLKAGYIDEITANMGVGGISDSYGAILEAAKAKHSTAKINVMTVILESWIAIVKLFLRRGMRKLKTMLKPIGA